jgi:hypothetical protein
MDLLTACPDCGLRCYVPKDTTNVECSSCGCSYDPWDDEECDFDTEPDYGGSFDGFNVYSDADTGL